MCFLNRHYTPELLNSINNFIILQSLSIMFFHLRNTCNLIVNGTISIIIFVSFTGDTFTIIDGVTQEEVSICNSLLNNDWLSSGNIAILKFISGADGHGISYTYEAFPQNETSSGKLVLTCSIRYFNSFDIVR